MLNQSFTKRHGFNYREKEITVRYDAPHGLREYVIYYFIEQLGYEPKRLREIICRVLHKLPDTNNWTPYPNIYNEAVSLVFECEWFYVYDIIEGLYHSLKENDKLVFENEMNDFFAINGIGWKISSGIIETRGDENFEIELSKVVTILDNAGLDTAKIEIKEALVDLSRRPEPDVTGAIQHSLACLECVVRYVAGNSKLTLGELIKKYSNIVPKPLDEAISKVWGFTSEQGRHLREGGQPTYEEAELVVGLSAVLTTYLGKKIKPEV